MHFDILIEDASGKKALNILVPKIIGNDHTYTIKSYKGIGRIPKGLKRSSDPAKRILLAQLPKLLQGYGKTYAGYPDDYPAVLIFVCDLDDKCPVTFKSELLAIRDSCNPPPKTRFCFAIEEGEAWFLGDLAAIQTAYPSAKLPILTSYSNDSICGTWEHLAEAIFPGGRAKLEKQGYQKIGAVKSEWAARITPCMDVENNDSPSFCYFRDNMRGLL